VPRAPVGVQRLPPRPPRTFAVGNTVDPVAGIPFLTDFQPRYGECIEVADGIRRVVAHNPSKYTAWGTGTYLVGDGPVAIIDPGPADEAHIDAVLRAVAGQEVTHLLITHTHADHSPATAAIKGRTGATTYGFGPHPDDADATGEEHGDTTFRPDVAVRHGDVVRGDGFEFDCLHTPGHISNHICYAERERGALFSGDHVMGWSTTVVSPPDGSMADYVASLRLLLDRPERAIYPTHGPPIEDPRRYVEALIEHRLEREDQILEQLRLGPRTVAEIVSVLYADVREELHEPAARTVEAHLIALAEADRARVDGERWSL
jgi:glyoxylase-like metal-dependent hydrolase (beta-lactamase superfamily II)